MKTKHQHKGLNDLMKIQQQLSKAMIELKSIDNEENQLVYDYIEHSNILIQNLTLHNHDFSLLKKYIEHVDQSEGTNFIGSCNNSISSNVKFSDKEIEILNSLS